MKYTLKKDLPFAGIGDNVFVRDSISCKNYVIISVSNAIDAPCCYAHKELSSDWLEEIKPREYKLGLNKDGTFAYIWDLEGRGYDAQRKYPTAETIKVREVIE